LSIENDKAEYELNIAIFPLTLKKCHDYSSDNWPKVCSPWQPFQLESQRSVVSR